MNPFESITLTTPRLTLRWLNEADAPALFEIHSHPEVMRYWASPPWQTMAEADQFVTRVLEGYRTGQALQLGVERNEDQVLLGSCALFSIYHTSRRGEIGYSLGRPYWGHGYMGEALKVFIGYLFDALHFNRLEADIDPRNLASAKTLERLGFQREGYLRERWIVSGEVSDTALYGLLRSEFATS
jgi:RimJ/RimL family protein N-acetyltransferase